MESITTGTTDRSPVDNGGDHGAKTTCRLGRFLKYRCTPALLWYVVLCIAAVAIVVTLALVEVKRPGEMRGIYAALRDNSQPPLVEQKTKYKMTGKADNTLGQFIKKGNGSKFRNDTIIIIHVVAYRGSGSSFTASIFQEITSAFYLYEPVRVLDYTIKRWSNTVQKMQSYVDAINIWLNCNLSSFTTKGYRERKSTPCKHGCCGKKSNSCLQALEIYCEKSPVKILKFIRLRMRYILQLLQMYPNMKVIHLVRDPRGIMSSSSRHFPLSPLTKLNVQKQCDEMADDLTFSKKSIVQYPKRLLIVNYENLAEQPIETTKKMFRFAGLNFSNNIELYLKSRTHADRIPCKSCLFSLNSSATAMQWRTKIDSNSSIFIHHTCRLSNGVLGYLPLSNDSAMKNYSIPSRKVLDVHQELLSNNNFKA